MNTKSKTDSRSGVALFTVLFAVALLSIFAAVMIPQIARAGIINTSLNAGTNVVAAATTNDYRAVANGGMAFATTTKGWVQFSAACSGASTANYDITFDTSLDGSSWQSNVFAIRLVANGTAKATTNYAIPSGFLAPAIRIGTIANTNAATTVLTNVLVNGFTAPGI